MSTDLISNINLDGMEVGLLSKNITKAGESDKPLIHLTGSIANWESIQNSLLILRASNKSALLHLKRGVDFLEDDEIQYLFSTLRDWDQLTVENFMEICGEWVPQEFQPILKNEAKIEQKWTEEWLTASTDEKIAKYPGLPWRSFIRKTIGENYQFAVRFLELAAAPATEENVALMVSHIKAFLEAKKKVVCVFPKKWGKQGESH